MKKVHGLEESRLKLARTMAKKTQQDAAKALNASIDKVWRIERGDKSPTICEAQILAALYSTTVAYLAGETDDIKIKKDTPADEDKFPTRVGSPLASKEIPVNESLPARDSDVFATIGILINQLEKTYPNMTEEDQQLARGLLNRCMRIVSSNIEDEKTKEAI